MASKLYKTVQRDRATTDSDSSHINTNDLLSDMEDNLSRSCGSVKSNSTTSRKRSNHESDPQTVKKSKSASCSSASSGNSRGSFKLPVFSPDIQQCISKDSFYTSTQRNRLIKESCVALRGYCWEHGVPISNDEKRSLAQKLCSLAPKSLGDTTSGKNAPEVRF